MTAQENKRVPGRSDFALIWGFIIFTLYSTILSFVWNCLHDGRCLKLLIVYTTSSVRMKTQLRDVRNNSAGMKESDLGFSLIRCSDRRVEKRILRSHLASRLGNGNLRMEQIQCSKSKWSNQTQKNTNQGLQTEKPLIHHWRGQVCQRWLISYLQ